MQRWVHTVIARLTNLTGDVLITNATNRDTLRHNGSRWVNTPIPVSSFKFASTRGVWTNMPAAVTEWYGSAANRLIMDCRSFTQWWLNLGIGNVAGLAGSKAGLQFSNDSGTTFFGADNGTSGAISTVTAAADTGTFTTVTTAWATLHTNARIDDCMFRAVGADGDGAVDPQLMDIALFFR